MTSSAADSPPVARPWRFTLRGLLVFVTLLAMLLAVVHSFNRMRLAVRQAIARSITSNNFKQAMLGLHNFQDMHGSLPYSVHLETDEAPWGRPIRQRQSREGKPLYSWRYSIIPFVVSYTPGPAFDAAWDCPAQSVWRARWTPFAKEPNPKDPTWANTTMLSITGPGTPWGDGTTPPLSLEDLDGDTILIVEVRNSGTHWMQPGDFDIRTMPRTINAPDGKGICGEYANGFTIGLADGRVRFLPSNVPFEVLEKFFTVEGAKQYDLDEELAAYLHD